MPLNLVLLTLHRLASHCYKLGRHASGDALRVVSVDGQRQLTRKGLTGMHATAQLLSQGRLTLGGYNYGAMMRSSLGLT